jgi:hypothetical protein
MTSEQKVKIEEAGHHVLATHFGASSFPMLTPGGYTPPGSSETFPYAGVCISTGPGSFPLQRCAISFAGMMAVHMCGGRWWWSPTVPLQRPYLRDWFDMFFERGFSHLSLGDRQGITCDKRQWRAFLIAWRVLRKNLARLRRLADFVVEDQAHNEKEQTMFVSQQYQPHRPFVSPAEQHRIALEQHAAWLEHKLDSMHKDHTGREDVEKSLADCRRQLVELTPLQQ